MKCLKCGQENRNDAGKCFKCGTPMLWTPDSDSEPGQPVEVKVSMLAIAAIILAIFGVILYITPFFLGNRSKTLALSIIGFLVIPGLGISVLALILGIVSLIRIETGGGRITGLSFAIGSILIPIVACLIPVFFIITQVPRKIATPMVCGANLSGIGKAMLIYANDYQDEFPRAGGKNNTWGTGVNWNAANRIQAYGTNTGGQGGSVTISASLYLLVKYAEVTPKSFICKGDKGVSEFIPSGNTDLILLWDFGPQPELHNSYAYNMPYSQLALTTSSDPGMAVAADRNPWMPSPGWGIKNFSAFNPNGNINNIREGNSFTHENQGQNVLYLDSHVAFQSVSFCGLNNDNIYTSWNAGDIRKGTPPKLGSQPVNRADSLLVNDPLANKR